MDRIKTLIIAIIAIIGFVGFVPTAAHAASPTAIITVSDASHNGGPGWNITLNDGTVLFIEARVFETGGKAPAIGVITNFVDQSWYVFAYGGYASLQDANGVVYHGFRP